MTRELAAALPVSSGWGLEIGQLCEVFRRADPREVCQVDGGRWLSLEGPVRLVTDRDGVRAGVDGYAARYRQPAERDDRVVIEIDVDRILGRA